MSNCHKYIFVFIITGSSWSYHHLCNRQLKTQPWETLELTQLFENWTQKFPNHCTSCLLGSHREDKGSENVRNFCVSSHPLLTSQNHSIWVLKVSNLRNFFLQFHKNVPIAVHVQQIEASQEPSSLSWSFGTQRGGVRDSPHSANTAGIPGILSTKD